MSDREIQRLRQQLEQERREKEQERREKEEAKAREEQERRRNQKTTLEEYLYNSHFHLYNKLGLADLSRSSTGFTKVEGKYYPKWLRPWREFENVHRRRHFEAMRTACGGRRLFHQESTTRDIGSTIFRKRAGNENAIDHFEKLAVEDPVWEILRCVWDTETLRKEYRCSDLTFSNNRRDVTSFSDGGQSSQSQGGWESQERRRRTGPSKRVASEKRFKRPSTNPDGWGVRTYPGGDESPAFVFDYKAAHKIAAGAVKSAVEKEKLFMEVMRRVCSDEAENDSTVRERQKTDEIIAMALTQVFDYMVRYGVAYGYVAAGATLLLLHVDQADLQTLYCHVCVPEEDVGESSEEGLVDNKVMYTAVAQLASFCLLSLLSDALRGLSLEEASQAASATLRTWGEPYEDSALLPKAQETESSSAPSSQEGSRYTSSVSPSTRKVALRRRPSCRGTDAVAKGDEEDENSDGEPPESQPWVSTGKRKDGPSSSGSEGDDPEAASSAPTRQYCTQACLLGLKRGKQLDGNCPNIRLHQAGEGGTKHPIHAEAFTRLVGEQLRQNQYYKCDALDGWGKRGSVGVLFKLELDPYGYTFVGKGVLPGHAHALEHERGIYARLERLQGYVVPVYLGIVELESGHIRPGGARVFNMMLMSWGGEKASKAGLSDLATEVRRSLQAVWAEGVDHGDERDDNLLWNTERQQVMIIDLDQAVHRPKPRNRPLIKVSGMKRKRNGNDFESCRNRPFLSSRAQVA